MNMALSKLSDYSNNLDTSARERYLQKIMPIRREDPYTLDKSELSKDVSDLPDLRYCLQYNISVLAS